MPLLTWNDDLSVGVREIDAQHHQLVELTNQLHAAMTQGQGRMVLGQILAGLIDYTRTHFAAEERLMATYAYPDATPHKAAHDALTQQVLDLQSKISTGQAAITLEVMKFLKDWLSNHILGMDKALGTHLKTKGLR